MSPTPILHLLLRAKPVVVQFAKTVASDPVFVQLVINAGKAVFRKDDVTEEPIGTTDDGAVVMAQFHTCPTCAGRGRVRVPDAPPVDGVH